MKHKLTIHTYPWVTTEAQALLDENAALLDALEKLVKSIEVWEGDVEKIVGRVPRHYMELDIARAAILRAKGGE